MMQIGFVESNDKPNEHVSPRPGRACADSRADGTGGASLVIGVVKRDDVEPVLPGFVGFTDRSARCLGPAGPADVCTVAEGRGSSAGAERGHGAERPADPHPDLKMAFVKLHHRKHSVVAADMLNGRILPFL